jgi:hypothetical protein
MYFIQAGGENGPIKIGIAGTPERRLQYLQTGCPDRLHLLATVPFANAYRARQAERDAHLEFAAHRRRGEWFSAAIRPVAMLYASLHRGAIVAACLGVQR